MLKVLRVQYAPDLAKAIGISLVVFGHVLRGLMNSRVVQPTEFWLSVDKLIYLFHMPLFFFLSGLFFKETLIRRGYGATIIKNVTVLLIPLVFWSYLQFSLQYMAGDSANVVLSINDVLMAPIPPRQQFWFLWALFQVTAVVGAVMQVSKSNWTLAGLAFVAVVLNLLGFGEIGSNTLGNDMIRNSPYFLFGVMGGVRFLEAYRLGNLAVLSIFALSLLFYGAFESPAEITRLVTSTICVLAIYKLTVNLAESSSSESLGWLRKAALFIGMNSMIIYLAHVIFEAGFRALLIRFGVTDLAAHIVGGVFCGIAAPLALVPVGLFAARVLPGLITTILPVRTSRG